MLEIFWDLRWLVKSEMVKEFCDQGLTKLVTIDETECTCCNEMQDFKSVSAVTQSFAKFYIWPESVPNNLKLMVLRNQRYVWILIQNVLLLSVFCNYPKISLMQDL